MNLKPCKNNLLVKFYPPSNTTIVLPDAAKAPIDSEHRVKCKVLAVSEFLDPKLGKFAVGEFLLLRPQYNFLPINQENFLALIDASVIEAIVLDDEEPK